MGISRSQHSLWLTAFALCLSATTALAGPFDGGYYGISAGTAQTKTTTQHSLSKPVPGNNPTQNSNTINGMNSLNPSLDGNSPSLGFYGGYNWSFGKIVVGIEGDANYWAGYREAVTQSMNVPTNGGGVRTLIASEKAEASYVLTLRPRLGFAFSERSMAYVSAGIALSDLKYSSSSAISTGATFYPSQTESKNGTVYGAGYEYRWSERLGLRLDYQHVDFGSVNVSGAADFLAFIPPDLVGSSYQSTYKTKSDFLRLGLTFKF